MIELDVDVSNRLGLHARAAAKFVHLANSFSARISVSKGTMLPGRRARIHWPSAWSC